MARATPSAQDILRQLEQAGFIVAGTPPGRIKVGKSNCVAYLESPEGHWIYSAPPYLVVHGTECELEDCGYQKFWYSRSNGQRFPIRPGDLETLHRFDEEVRYLLDMKSLYNESLGSTNARTIYDRLAGRPDR